MPTQGVTNAANAIVNKINNRISSHNSDTNAHQDIRAKLPSYGSFTELQNLINNTAANGTLILKKDYKNTGTEEYITIPHSMTIIGNGHTIDADSHNKIITIDDSNVESSFHDIIFLNGVCEKENGGAIYSDGNLGVFNCSFINCRGWYNGGAISGNDVTIKDSIFINCTASDGDGFGDGGAVCSYDGEIQDCLFINNHADSNGGAVYLVSPTKHIKNSLFLNNTALNEGGGVYSANINNYEVYNCTFDQISTLYNTVNVGYVQIADNLTTDDATKALSAKQGKVLNDLIGDAIEYINQ